MITEEMLSGHDWYATFAALAGASDKVPTDRPMDSVDASKFLTRQERDDGPGRPLFFGPDGSLMSAKHHNIKIWLRYCEGFEKPILKPAFPLSTTSAATRARNGASSTTGWTWAGR